MNIFQYNTGLKKLNLAANNIPYINPDIFANSRAIETLDISNNGMEVIWKSDSENKTIPSLSVLNLADNRLVKVTVSDLEVVPSLKVLNLNNNDLQCTMEFKAAVRWLNMGTVIHSASGMNAELTVDQMMTSTDPYWNDLYSLACAYVLDRDDYEEEEDEDIDIDEDEYGKVVYDEIEMLRNERIMHDDWVYTRERYTFLWSILVFVVTALFVLFMVTNIILCILRKRGQLPRNINLTWKNGGHSGFVYKPLTEDISRPRSIIIAQGDKLQAPNL
ncbi:Leucine rich repeat [Popillia japonica]